MRRVLSKYGGTVVINTAAGLHVGNLDALGQYRSGRPAAVSRLQDYLDTTMPRREILATCRRHRRFLREGLFACTLTRRACRDNAADSFNAFMA
jgi:hypothetical protein